MNAVLWTWKAREKDSGEVESLSVGCPHSPQKLWLASRIAALLDRWEEFWMLVALFRQPDDEEDEED